MAGLMQLIAYGLHDLHLSRALSEEEEFYFWVVTMIIERKRTSSFFLYKLQILANPHLS